MKFQKKVHIAFLIVGLIGLGGCQAPHGAHYNMAAYDASPYDAATYAPQYAAEPSYDTSYYHHGR